MLVFRCVYEENKTVNDQRFTSGWESLPNGSDVVKESFLPKLPFTRILKTIRQKRFNSSRNMELGGGNSNLLYFHPYFWAKNPQFWQNHIFQMGFCSKPPTSEAFVLFLCGHLDGGFKYFLFSSLPGVSWSNLTNIFFRWVGSTTNQSSWCPKRTSTSKKDHLKGWCECTNQGPCVVWTGTNFCWGETCWSKGDSKKWPWWRRQ